MGEPHRQQSQSGSEPFPNGPPVPNFGAPPASNGQSYPSAVPQVPQGADYMQTMQLNMQKMQELQQQMMTMNFGKTEDVLNMGNSLRLGENILYTMILKPSAAMPMFPQADSQATMMFPNPSQTASAGDASGGQTVMFTPGGQQPPSSQQQLGGQQPEQQQQLPMQTMMFPSPAAGGGGGGQQPMTMMFPQPSEGTDNSSNAPFPVAAGTDASGGQQPAQTMMFPAAATASASSDGGDNAGQPNPMMMFAPSGASMMYGGGGGQGFPQMMPVVCPPNGDGNGTIMLPPSSDGGGSIIPPPNGGGQGTMVFPPSSPWNGDAIPEAVADDDTVTPEMLADMQRQLDEMQSNFASGIQFPPPGAQPPNSSGSPPPPVFQQARADDVQRGHSLSELGSADKPSLAPVSQSVDSVALHRNHQEQKEKEKKDPEQVDTAIFGKQVPEPGEHRRGSCVYPEAPDSREKKKERKQNKRRIPAGNTGPVHAYGTLPTAMMRSSKEELEELANSGAATDRPKGDDLRMQFQRGRSSSDTNVIAPKPTTAEEQSSRAELLRLAQTSGLEQEQLFCFLRDRGVAENFRFLQAVLSMKETTSDEKAEAAAKNIVETFIEKESKNCIVRVEEHEEELKRVSGASFSRKQFDIIFNVVLVDLITSYFSAFKSLSKEEKDELKKDATPISPRRQERPALPLPSGLKKDEKAMSRINGMMRIHQSALTKIDKSQVKRLCDLDTKNSQQDTPKLEPFETRHKGFLLQQEKLMEKERGAVSKLADTLQREMMKEVDAELRAEKSANDAKIKQLEKEQAADQKSAKKKKILSKTDLKNLKEAHKLQLALCKNFYAQSVERKGTFSKWDAQVTAHLQSRTRTEIQALVEIHDAEVKLAEQVLKEKERAYAKQAAVDREALSQKDNIIQDTYRKRAQQTMTNAREVERLENECMDRIFKIETKRRLKAELSKEQYSTLRKAKKNAPKNIVQQEIDKWVGEQEGALAAFQSDRSRRLKEEVKQSKEAMEAAIKQSHETLEKKIADQLAAAKKHYEDTVAAAKEKLEKNTKAASDELRVALEREFDEWRTAMDRLYESQTRDCAKLIESTRHGETKVAMEKESEEVMSKAKLELTSMLDKRKDVVLAQVPES